MAIVANLTADQGSDFISEITVEDYNGNVSNISNYTARGQVRRTYLSSTSVDFNATVSNPTSGELTIELTSAQTSAMKAGRYVYDVEIVSSGGTVTRVVEGQFEIMPSVTR